MQLEDIESGHRLAGLVAGGVVTILAAQRHGPDALEVTFKTTAGSLGQIILYRADESRLSITHATGRPFDAPASDFKLAAEAQRIELAGSFDPMLAVATSDVQPPAPPDQRRLR